MKAIYYALILFYIGLYSVSVISQDAKSQSTGPISIISIENSFDSDQTNVSGNSLLVKTSDFTIKNPGNCSLVDGYVLGENASSVSRSMILAAKAANKKISFTIYHGNCIRNRPNIVSVKMASE